MRRWLVLLSLSVIAVAARDAQATCNPGQNPFVDVTDVDIFCGSALWLRNSLVTTGCPPGNKYCPADPVTRAQMALFMKRLARAVVPDIVYGEEGGGPGDVDAGYPLCTTSPYVIPAGSNARLLLSAMGNISLLTDAPAEVVVTIQRSANGGPFVTLGGMFTRTTVPGNQWTTIPVQWSQTSQAGSGALLGAGTSHVFRIEARRFIIGTTGEISAGRCHLKVDLPVDATP